MPYLYGEQYENFDKMKAGDALYPTILQDKFMNYEVEKKHYAEIRRLAERSEWKRRELTRHYKEHNKHFGNRYETEQAYNIAARELLKDEEAGQALIYSLKNNNLCLLVWKEDIDSKKGSCFTGIIDLIEQKLLTYHKKEASQIEKELKGEKTIKVLIMKEGARIKKGEIKRMKDKIIAKQDLIPIIEDIDAIGFYGMLPRHIRGEYDASLFEVDDAIDCRDTFIQQAYENNLLNDEQIKEVKKIDDYILRHRVPVELGEFKEWLKAHQLQKMGTEEEQLREPK